MKHKLIIGCWIWLLLTTIIVFVGRGKNLSKVEILPRLPIYTAQELQNILERNTLLISEMKGQTIRVTGVIDSFDRMPTLIPGEGDPIVYLDAGSYNRIFCWFNKSEHDRIIRLHTGQTVTVVGEIDYPSLGMVNLRNCRF